MNMSNNNVFATYQFRAECLADAELIRSTLWPWVLEWKVVMSPIEHDGLLLRTSDAEVEFTASEAAPPIEQLRWLIDGLINCHIAAETIQLTHEYTGERVLRRNWTGPVQRPDFEVMTKAVAAIVKRQEVLRIESERSQHVYRTLKTVQDLGARWTPPSEDSAAPGWLAVMENGIPNLQRLVRVTPMDPRQFLKGAKGSSREVDRRARVISA
jgi:hypothetical protein